MAVVAAAVVVVTLSMVIVPMAGLAVRVAMLVPEDAAEWEAMAVVAVAGCSCWCVAHCSIVHPCWPREAPPAEQSWGQRGESVLQAKLDPPHRFPTLEVQVAMAATGGMAETVAMADMEHPAAAAVSK